MKFVSRVAAAIGAVALLASPIGTAHAVEIPSDLEYSYDLNQPVIGNMSLATRGDCTQTLGAPFTLAMVGGVEEALTDALATANNDVTCTLDVSATSSGSTLSGSVSASGQGMSGSGTFTLVCDVGRTVNSWFRVLVDGAGDAALAPDPYGVESDGYVSCNWTIDVADAQKSQLSGSLEMQGSFSSDSTPVDWSNCAPLGLPIPPQAMPRAKCIEFEMDIQAYLTGSTGAFAGRTGEGSMTQTVYAPMLIPISLDAGPTPPPPPCPADQPDCTQLDLTGCEYSPTDPGDPSWLDLSGLPAGAKIPGFKGPGWYRCSGGGGGGGGGDFTNCEYSPTDPGLPGWGYTELPPGVSIPGYRGPGWYNCGDLPPVPTSFDPQMIRAAFAAVLSPRAGGDLLSLSTQTGKAMAPRFVAPAQTTSAAVRPFVGNSSTTVRLSTVPGATCTVSAVSGKSTSTLVKAARALKGQVDTKVTAATLMSRLKVAKGASAVVTANCTTKVGKRTVKLPAARIQVRFS
jgi:hypothetical protein